MIEKIILDYLTETFSCPVLMEEPKNDKAGQYILIEKTGSSRENFVNSATVAIQSYAESLYDAADLNEQVKAAMYDIIELDDIGSCKLNSDYNFTDTSTKRYRYQAVFDIVHY